MGGVEPRPRPQRRPRGLTPIPAFPLKGEGVRGRGVCRRQGCGMRRIALRASAYGDLAPGGQGRPWLRIRMFSDSV